LISPVPTTLGRDIVTTPLSVMAQRHYPSWRNATIRHGATPLSVMAQCHYPSWRNATIRHGATPLSVMARLVRAIRNGTPPGHDGRGDDVSPLKELI
jgi:hypothetical protein